MAQIAVFGLWHLGCVVSTALASLGHCVTGTDSDPRIVNDLLRGEPPLYEPGLAELMAVQVREGRLSFVPWGREALAKATSVFITFDTPVDEDDQSDLSPVERAFDLIGSSGKRELGIVLMSQVPVGTCQQLSKRLQAASPGLSFTLVYQPENLRLGEALKTFLEPDLIVMGAQEEEAAARMMPLYDGIPARRLVMSWNSAELYKHTLNAFLATSVSFVNEIADLADVTGADIRDVVGALRFDRRVGQYAFLSPGPGFAGGTLARDIQTLRRAGENHGCPTLQLDATLAVNTARLPAMARKIERLCGNAGKSQIGLLGLTYKPGTSTLRRSSALTLARLLLRGGCQVRAFDPQVVPGQSELAAGITLCATPYEAAARSDVLVVMTPWPEFKQLDFSRLAGAMRQPVLVDAHNFLDAGKAQEAGFRYLGTGIAEETLRCKAKV